MLRRALKLYRAGQYWPALLQYLLLAEQGCEVAVANAAFMLQRGQGAGGEQAMRLAARMLVRWVGDGGGGAATGGSAAVRVWGMYAVGLAARMLVR